jgi:catechol 2,3-dioxygenase-like lactoylglutathione lyase family enzyme
MFSKIYQLAARASKNYIPVSRNSKSTRMLNKSKVISFIATQNPAKALEFYKTTLGLALTSDDPFAVVFDANGTMLRVQKVQEIQPAQHTVLGWEVPNIRAAVEQLIKNGVRFERFEGLPQDELGVWTAPSGGKVAWFKDPDGNTLSLTQFQ